VHNHDDDRNVNVRFHAYKVKFLNSNSGVASKEGKKLSTYHNYLIGNDRNKWAGRVGLFEQVQVNNIYNGIDISLYRASSALKYDFIVAPNANPGQIRLQFEGVMPVLNAKGQLVINTSVNTIVE